MDLRDHIKALEDEIEHYRNACIRQSHEIEQTLGKALGYPEYGPEVCSDGNPNGWVCVGEHVAESLATEAANRIQALEEAAREARAVLADVLLVLEAVQRVAATWPEAQGVTAGGPVDGAVRATLSRLDALLGQGSEPPK